MIYWRNAIDENLTHFMTAFLFISILFNIYWKTLESSEIKHHPFSKYAQFSEKLVFLTP